MATRKLGILTGGGDCPGLNAVIRGAVLSAKARGWEVLGIEDATCGLIDLDYRSPFGNRWLEEPDVRGILTRGGTILGTSNKSDPFKYVVERDGAQVEEDISDRLVENAAKLGLDALISVGGDGSMRIAQKLGAKGLKIVGVPKTIDQDLAATDTTFGFDTAVQTAAEAIDRIQDTAASHDRVMLVEVMGRDAGWIALHAAIAAGAHLCVIPELPYKIDPLVQAIQQRKRQNMPFAVGVVAEGARPHDGEASYEGPRELGAMRKLFGAASHLAARLEPHLDLDVRVTVLGHIQRGGSPTQFDRILGTRFGVHAVDLVERGQFDHMVALRTPDIVAVPLAEAVRQQRLVSPDDNLIRTAKAVGIAFGDE